MEDETQHTQASIPSQSEAIPWSPIPEEVTIQWGPHQIVIMRYKGKEYVNMANAWKYLGKSKPTGDRKILDEAESGRITRYGVGEKEVYILRKDLDRLHGELNDPVPLPPPSRSGKGSKSKSKEEVKQESD